jgi:methylphosphotriester-DNA--protein-cysteine methyltransferase
VDQKINDADNEIMGVTYILNEKTKKFHLPSCSALPTENKVDATESRELTIMQGYEACGRCHP